LDFLFRHLARNEHNGRRVRMFGRPNQFVLPDDIVKPHPPNALRMCTKRLPEALENQYDRCNT
jgi:hypothetical protein